MTSSFSNVIGTPRDQLPDISDTNYLATDADLTKAVNEQIDENIKDSKRFYDEMIEIEKNRTQALDKRLKALNQFIGSADKYKKALEADRVSREIDKVRFAGDKKSIDKILELQKEEKKQDFFLMDMEGFVKRVFESTGGKVDIRANSDEAYQTLSDITYSFNRDEDLRTQLRSVKPATIRGNIDTLLGQLGFDSVTEPLAKEQIRQFAEQTVRNKIHVGVLDAGFDISSGRYKKNFLKIIQPGITEYLKDRNYKWESTYIQKLEAKRKQDFKDRVEDYIGAINSTPAEGQDLTLFNDKEGIGLIAQYKATYHPDDPNGQQKSMMFVAETVAELVKDNPKNIPYAEALLEKLVYSDRSTKTDYPNVEEYQNSIDFEKEPKRYKNITEFIRTIKDGIRDAKDNQEAEDDATYEDNVKAFKEKYYQPLVDRVKTRPNNKITRWEATEIYTKFLADEDLYNAADQKMQVPQWLNDMWTKADMDGLDAGVAKRLEFAKLVNERSQFIQDMIKARKASQGLKSQLEPNDLLLAKRLQDILAAELIEGTTGPVSQLDIEIRNAGTPESFLDGRLKEIETKFMNGEYDGLGQRLSNDGAEKAEQLRLAYQKDPSLLFSPEVHDGEAIHLDKALMYIRSGGQLNPEVIDYFKTFRYESLTDENGNPLDPHEIMVARLKATGAITEDDVYGKRLKKNLEYLTSEDKKYLLTNGTHGLHNIVTKDGGKHAKQVLENLQSIYANGEFGNHQKGYQYYNTGYARNRFGTNISANVFGQNITNRNIEYIAKIAQLHPKVEMGMYGITGEQFLQIYNQEGFKEAFNANQKFDGDFQDYLVFEMMRYKLQRSNSIRGMEFDNKGRYVTKLSHFNPEEIAAMNEIFPNLKNMTFSQLHNLSPAIAKLLLNDIRPKFNLEEQQKKVQKDIDKVGGDVYTP